MADNSLITKSHLRSTAEHIVEKLNDSSSLSGMVINEHNQDTSAHQDIRDAIPTTAEDVGALPIGGGTLTGKSLYLYNGQARVLGDTNRIQFETYNTAGDTTNRRVLHLRNTNHNETDIADALALYDMSDGVQTIYKLYGEHNPPPGGAPIASATSSDGVDYTATVDGIDALTAGQFVIFIPGASSTSASPTLNINGLGAKVIKRRLSGLSSQTASGNSTNWLYVGKPHVLMYDGVYWIAANQDKPMASDLYGTTGVNHGGTGLPAVTSGSFLVGNGVEPMIEKTPAEVLNLINAASVQAVTTAEYEALGTPAANTIYALTDGEEEDSTVGPHASTHAADGSDPITPEMIGALPSDPSTKIEIPAGTDLKQYFVGTNSPLGYHRCYHGTETINAPIDGLDSYWFFDRTPSGVYATCAAYPNRLWWGKGLNGVFYGWLELGTTDNVLTVPKTYITGVNILEWVETQTESSIVAVNSDVTGMPFDGAYWEVELRITLNGACKMITATHISSIDNNDYYAKYENAQVNGLWNGWTQIATTNNAVRKAGDTMTGNLIVSRPGYSSFIAVDTNTNSAGRCLHNAHATIIEANNDNANPNVNRRGVSLRDSEKVASLAEALILYDFTDSVYSWRTILHTGNKPSGSYTGNGDATTRTLATGGLGGVLEVHNANGMAIVTPSGAIGKTGTTLFALPASEVNYNGGVLTMATTNAVINAANITSYYNAL